MKKWLLLFALTMPAWAVVVAPATLPHVTFVNASGGPCASCTLQSFLAGTSTPTPTYTDSTGVSANTNPIILDAAGGANIWLANLAYKLILKDPTGTIIWTVDNVKGGGGLGGICGPAGAIQIANSGVNGLTCDPAITIDPTTHTLNVGTLPASHVTIGALGTPTSWNFDTTTPATALNSLGGVGDGAGTATPNQLIISTATLHQLAFSPSIPDGITAITRSPSDDSANPATTAYVAFPGAINPTTVTIAGGALITANQGNGEKAQHSTGTFTTDNCTKFDASGNTVDAGSPCNVGITSVLNDETVARSWAVNYQNLAGGAMYVSGYATTPAGSSTGNISCNVGPLSASIIVWANTATATISGGVLGFSCLVPPNYFYSITITGDVSSTPARWIETSIL